MSIRRFISSVFPPCLRVSVVFSLLLISTGCAHPSAANNKLREENDKLQSQIANLNRRVEGYQSTIHALEQKVGTVPTLPENRLDKLFTVHGITLGRLTGGEDTDPNKPGDEGLRVAVTPIDQNGDKLKAAGSITVDAFDLAASDNSHIGHWEFNEQATRSAWFGSSLLYCYVFKCPWQKPPSRPDLTVKVTFTDSLTNRQFTAQKVVKITLPTTKPTTQQAHSP